MAGEGRIRGVLWPDGPLPQPQGRRSDALVRYRYSRWDGTQQVSLFDDEDLLERLSEDILAGHDVEQAMRGLLRRGIEGGDQDQRIEGLHDLMQRVQEQRRNMLERFNLESLIDDLKERLRDVVETERRGIDRRLNEAREQLDAAGESAEHLRTAMDLLESRAARGKQTLDELPDSTAGSIRELREYEFIDPDAQRKFDELLDMLNRQAMESFAQGMRQQLQNMTPEQLDELRNMTRALNQMLHDRANGVDPDFDGFMDEFGHMFDPNRPASLDELLERLAGQMAAAQSLMNSMSPEMRAELSQMLDAALDPELRGEMDELMARMQMMFPFDTEGQEYPFMGDEPVTLEQAMEAMGELQGLDNLEQRVKDVIRRGNVEDLDPAEVEEYLGEDARRQLEDLQRVVQQLEEAGYLRRKGDRLELTARAIRKLAQQALRQVFSELRKEKIGSHPVYVRGEGGESTGETKKFEFGDGTDIDLHKTVFNGVLRQGPSVPVKLTADDLEVRQSEHLSRAATVLLLDQSRSMGMYGNFIAAKRVALALYWLIKSQYKGDFLGMVGFSDYAMEISTENLGDLTWNAWVGGTNMHHALMLSRKMLAKEKAATKNILMITDGEPTAHLEGGHAYFSYPPSYSTINLTLDEVRRCTKEGITINTFMLEASYLLIDFINHVTRINRGRAFYSTPGQLGKYVVVDYLKSRKGRSG